MGLTLTPNQRKFLTTLRSGTYKQGHGVLHSTDNEFCCIGVAAHLFSPAPPVLGPGGVDYAYDSRTCTAPQYVVAALGLRGPCGETINPETCPPLVELNDTLELSFKQIADRIEANPQEYFV